jgi:hypothetical protein
MNAPEVIKPLMRPFLPATADFGSGKDSPRCFLERCIAELDTWEPKIGAFVTLNIAGARAAADCSTERWRAGKPLSPIDGMPIGIKDIIETIDMPTENGSPLFAGFRSERDSASVAALREAGGVILGKTVTTEFAAAEPRGTRNPWDQTRTPGGSSSGSAAAVALGAISVPGALIHVKLFPRVCSSKRPGRREAAGGGAWRKGGPGGLGGIVLPAQHLRQLGYVGGDAPGLVISEQVRR